jgi:hypothetical protein
VGSGGEEDQKLKEGFEFQVSSFKASKFQGFERGRNLETCENLETFFCAFKVAANRHLLPIAPPW